jgi:hypothetical protein
VRIAQYTHAGRGSEVEKDINGQPLPPYYITIHHRVDVHVMLTTAQATVLIKVDRCSCFEECTMSETMFSLAVICYGSSKASTVSQLYIRYAATHNSGRCYKGKPATKRHIPPSNSATDLTAAKNSYAMQCPNTIRSALPPKPFS